MNIVNMYGDVTWTDATIEDVINDALIEVEGGQVEQLRGQIRVLTGIVASLVERVAKDDSDALALVGRTWKWSVNDG